jgi:hypothetical protein
MKVSRLYSGRLSLINLERLANRDSDAGLDYSDRYLPRFKGNIGALTDCDSSGIEIGMKVKDATRKGIDPDTIDEINCKLKSIYPGLPHLLTR